MPLRPTFRRTLLAVSLAAAAGLASCGRPPRTNVILVTIDTLRNDHCSAAGYDRATTPRLDRLARDGTRMALAYAPTATTGPSHASILTSLYPIAHGVVKNGMTLEDGFVTLAETLRDRGYATGAVVSSFVLDSKFGYSQGFDVYEDGFDAAGSTMPPEQTWGRSSGGGFDERADVTTKKAVRLLDELAGKGRPFLLFVHYFDPHAPYVPPEPWDRRFGPPPADAESLEAQTAAYDGEIAFTDDELGKLLDHLAAAGLDRDTLVVVASDHGEGLMQHGHMHHGVQIYEEAVRVPLLFRLPERVAAGRTLDSPVELVDVMPTVLDLVGVEPASELQGRSLAAALTGDAPLDPERPIHLHRRHYLPGMVGDIPVAGEQFGIRVGNWKYIEGDEEATRELYDLQQDPGERVNVCEEFPEVADEMRERIAAWKLACGRDRDVRPLSPDDVERLKALGYVE